jgi:hypothetical protein
VAYITVPIETDPDALAQDAFDFLEAKTNGAWEPHDGQLDTWQLEANARMAATLRDIASDVPDSIFRYFGTLVGVPPIDGASATVTLTVNLGDTTGHTIPEGTHFAFTDVFGNLFEFASTIDVDAAPGATSVDVVVAASDEGLSASGLGGTGTQMKVLDDYAFISSAVMQSATAGGVEPEDDSDYLSRLALNLRLMSPRPITADDFAALATNTPGVARALALDTFDLPSSSTTTKLATLTSGDPTITGMGASYTGITDGALVSGPGILPETYVLSRNTGAGTAVLTQAPTITATPVSLKFQNGYGYAREITVALVDALGSAPPTATSDAVQATLESLRETNFVVFTTGPTYTDIDFQFDVNAWPGVGKVALNAAIVAALQDFANPATYGNPPSGDRFVWINNPRVAVNDAIGAIRNVDGVRDVNSLLMRTGAGSFAANDLFMSGAAPLPQFGSATGTVH